jgi:hypothetical protein
LTEDLSLDELFREPAPDQTGVSNAMVSDVQSASDETCLQSVTSSSSANKAVAQTFVSQCLANEAEPHGITQGVVKEAMVESSAFSQISVPSSSSANKAAAQTFVSAMLLDEPDKQAPQNLVNKQEPHEIAQGVVDEAIEKAHVESASASQVSDAQEEQGIRIQNGHVSCSSQVTAMMDNPTTSAIPTSVHAVPRSAASSNLSVASINSSDANAAAANALIKDFGVETLLQPSTPGSSIHQQISMYHEATDDAVRVPPSSGTVSDVLESEGFSEHQAAGFVQAALQNVLVQDELTPKTPSAPDPADLKASTAHGSTALEAVLPSSTSQPAPTTVDVSPAGMVSETELTNSVVSGVQTPADEGAGHSEVERITNTLLNAGRPDDSQSVSSGVDSEALVAGLVSQELVNELEGIAPAQEPTAAPPAQSKITTSTSSAAVAPQEPRTSPARPRKKSTSSASGNASVISAGTQNESLVEGLSRNMVAHGIGESTQVAPNAVAPLKDSSSDFVSVYSSQQTDERPAAVVLSKTLLLEAETALETPRVPDGQQMALTQMTKPSQICWSSTSTQTMTAQIMRSSRLSSLRSYVLLV